MCEGSTANFSISPVSGAAFYVWIPSGGPVSIINGSGTTQITLRIPEDFPSEQLQLKVYGVSSTGNAGPYSPVKAITVYQKITATPGSISGPNKVNNGESYIYSISPIPGATGYAWIPPNGTIISASGTSCTVTFLSSFTGGQLRVGAVNGPCGPGPYSILDISLKKPDFIVTNVSYPANGFLGDIIDIEFTIKNIGNAPGNAGVCKILYYSNGFHTLGNLVGNVSGGILNPGQSATFTSTITLASYRFEIGPCKFAVWADYNDQTTEFQELNNYGTGGTFNILPNLPDLEIQVITNPPIPMYENTVYQNKIRVLNTGPVGMQINTNVVLAMNGYILGNFNVPALNAHNSIDLTVTFTSLSYEIAGSGPYYRYLDYYVDPHNNIDEIFDDNNSVSIFVGNVLEGNSGGRIAKYEFENLRENDQEEILKNRNYIISVVNITGKIIWAKKESEDSFDIKSLNKGFYIITSLKDDKISTSKIFVKK